jgi:hypothetical protein
MIVRRCFDQQESLINHQSDNLCANLAVVARIHFLHPGSKGLLALHL